MATLFLRIACVVVFSVLVPSRWCHAADVVFIRSASGLAPEQQELQIATDFYGLNLRVMTAGDNPAISRAVGRSETRAAAIAADALGQVDETALQRALSRGAGGPIPLLILGVTSETNPSLLKAWSGGAVAGCRRLDTSSHSKYVFDRVAGVTRQLSGIELPFPAHTTFYFDLAEKGHAERIAEVRDENQFLPLFVQSNLDRQEVFLASRMPSPTQLANGWSGEDVVNTFGEVASAMLFVKYCAGESGWHSLHHYANLTIDDPWLHEPYGYLDYSGLLEEMEQHNFHTTIAFIPWNYDRSEPGVAALVRAHPERFSICIHGDNHDHQEFEDLQSKSLAVQTAALQEALSRMEKFQKLTGIPYDKVMVFPHNIGSAEILDRLKTLGFLATINSLNVPIGETRPVDYSFGLRPVTLMWGDFPSISRYSAEWTVSPAFYAVNDFLENPLLFYDHHDFFVNGIGAFDDVADQVNKIEPDTRWSNLGDIVRHLYLVRRRDDSSYDAVTFSSGISLENTSGHDSTFYVQKQETGTPSIASVSVDGQPCPYQLHEGHLDFSVAVPAGKTRSVAVLYTNPLPPPAGNGAWFSLRVYILRMFSDFRDMTLSKYAMGRVLIAYYYKYEITPTQVLLSGLVLIALCVCGSWSLRTIHRGAR